MIFNLLLSIVGILLTILIVVGVHEGAHFLTARLLGIKVLRCSIGFGKALYTWRDKKGTEYVLAPIPLGGYVKLLDESEAPVDEAEKHLAFNRQPLYKRAAVVIAGPLANILAAVLLYWLIFLIGFKTALPLIGEVLPHSISSAAKLKPMQVIVSVDGYPTQSWSQVTMRLITHLGNQDKLRIQTKPFMAESKNLQTFILNLRDWQMNELKPDPLSSLGLIPYEPAIPLILGQIKANSPAAHSPLKPGDKILAIEGKPLKTWEEVILFIAKNPDKKLVFLIDREHHQLLFPVQVGHQWNLRFHKQGFLGIGPNFELPDYLLQKIQYNFLSAFSHAVQEVVNLSYLNLLLFGKLITHKLSLYSLGGPLTIFQTAGSAFLYGLLSFLGFLAFLNVALGIINIFPIPGLDGGHLLFQCIEAIIRRPLSLPVQVFFYRLGFIFILFFLAQALTNDLLRLWN